MKTYSELMTEMNLDAAFNDAIKSRDLLHHELVTLFPGRIVFATFDQSQSRTLMVGVSAIPMGSPRDVIERPDHATMVFAMTVGSYFGKNDDLKKFTYEVGTSNDETGKKMKVRDITGRTPMDATKKVLKWYRDNKEMFSLK